MESIIESFDGEHSGAAKDQRSNNGRQRNQLPTRPRRLLRYDRSGDQDGGRDLLCVAIGFDARGLIADRQRLVGVVLYLEGMVQILVLVAQVLEIGEACIDLVQLL